MWPLAPLPCRHARRPPEAEISSFRHGELFLQEMHFYERENRVYPVFTLKNHLRRPEFLTAPLPCHPTTRGDHPRVRCLSFRHGEVIHISFCRKCISFSNETGCATFLVWKSNYDDLIWPKTALVAISRHCFSRNEAEISTVRPGELIHLFFCRKYISMSMKTGGTYIWHLVPPDMCIWHVVPRQHVWVYLDTLHIFTSG